MQNKSITGRGQIIVEVIPAANGDSRALEEARKFLAQEVLRRVGGRQGAKGSASSGLRPS